MAAGRAGGRLVQALVRGATGAVAISLILLAACPATYAAGAPSATRSLAALIEQGPKLSGAGEINHGAFGYSVGVSGDGSTAIVGAPQDKHGAGAVWIFSRSGNTWAPQGGKITATGEVGHGYFGISVALSEDGDIALVGSPKDGKGVGAAYVFTRTGETWTQAAKFSGAEELGHANFGRRISLSSDGQTALIGGFADNDNTGAAWVFIHLGESWTQQGPKLTGSSETGPGQFGGDVSLSGDGNTALVGGPTDDSGVGAAWFFSRSGDTWAAQGSKIAPSGEAAAAEFGRSVSLDGDGETGLVGGPTGNGGFGAAWVFAFNGEAWSQGARLTAPTTKGHPDFGRDVALSGTGETALVGAPKAHTTGGGEAWLFTLQVGEWVRQTEPLLGGAETKHGDFGRSVALSDDADTAIVGGPKDHKFGAAWTYGE